MAFVVHGVTGAQGRPVHSALQSGGHEVVAAVRTPSALPEGTRSATVELADVDTLTRAYSHADGVFIHLPMGSPQQLSVYAEAVVSALSQARPARVVISTSGHIVDAPDSPLQAAEDSPIVTLVGGAQAAGISTAVVVPRLYLENLLLPVIAGPIRDEGVLRYAMADTFPVSWCSHLDVADAVAQLLTTDTDITGTVAVGHDPGLVGPDLAHGFAARFGTEVRYRSITPGEFGDLILPLFGPDASAPVVGLYEALATQSGYTISPENSAQKLLGLEPRSVDTWLADIGM
jgi:uncharacterized protein YbjT (DUF2867 family)